MLIAVSPGRTPSPLAGTLALVLGLALGLACHVSNDDHCVHKAIESDAWCAENVPGRPYCSPCVADLHGCVAAPPDADECPAYTPDGASDSGSSSPASSG